jgi:hypothetical protein
LSTAFTKTKKDRPAGTGTVKGGLICIIHILPQNKKFVNRRRRKNERLQSI